MLEEKRRGPTLILDHEVGSPELGRQWSVMKNHPGSQRYKAVTASTLPVLLLRLPISMQLPKSRTLEIIPPTAGSNTALPMVTGEQEFFAPSSGNRGF